MTFEAELPKCTSFTTLALTSCDLRAELPKCISLLKSCDFRAGAAKVYFLFTALVLTSCDLRAGAAKQSFLVLKSCDFRAGAAKVYFLYCTCTQKLRLASRSCIVGFPHVNALEFGTWQSICMLANSCLSPWGVVGHKRATDKARVDHFGKGGTLWPTTPKSHGQR